MRLTRHAKNKARELGVTVADAEALIASPFFVDADNRWNPRYTGYIGDLRVRIVVALDDPTLIVTIHERRN